MFLLYVRYYLTVLHLFSYLIISRFPWRRHFYNPHVTDKKTEANKKLNNLPKVKHLLSDTVKFKLISWMGCQVCPPSTLLLQPASEYHGSHGNDLQCKVWSTCSVHASIKVQGQTYNKWMDAFRQKASFTCTYPI